MEKKELGREDVIEALKKIAFGRVNRGVELTSSVDDGEQSVITEQVTNGVAVRMALLYLLTRRA